MEEKDEKENEFLFAAVFVIGSYHFIDNGLWKKRQRGGIIGPNLEYRDF
jgi:hypothetical protein